MTVTRSAKPALRFAVSGVLAAVLLAGCASNGNAPRTAASASQAALAKGQVDRAITLAESAVAAAPRDAAARVALAQAYLKAGRFDSAATTFDDAMELGDNGARTALALALANVATGRNRDAVAILDDWRDSIAPADLGLALALAGEPSRGVAILAEAVRAGENTPKLRQNLAYAYALDGRWREARTMMAQDVAPDQLDARISEWAMMGKPEDHQKRVAALLSVPVRADSGQPPRLALSIPPAVAQVAAETAAVQPELHPIAAEEAKLPLLEAAPTPQIAIVAPAPEPAPIVEAAASAPASGSFATAFAESAPAAAPVIQPLAAAAAPREPRPARAAPARAGNASSGGSHLVQLGSFSSPQGARRAWGIFAARNPALRNYRMTITPVVVRGRNFWRVAAAGFDAGSARGMCSTVKARGGACLAYAATRAPAVGVPERGSSGPRMARRR